MITSLDPPDVWVWSDVVSVSPVEYLPNLIDDFMVVRLSDRCLLDWSSDPRGQADYNVACLRRRAWAKSKDSTWLESEEEGPQQNQRAGEEQTPSEETG